MPHTRSLWFVVAAASRLFDSSSYAAAPMASPAIYRTEQTPRDVSVEFDLPDEYWNQLDDGSYFVTGVRLGYFRTNGDAPIFTTDFDRAAVRVTGNMGRVPLDVGFLVASPERIVVRLRTLIRDDWSDWSEASESISIQAPNDARERPLTIRARR